MNIFEAILLGVVQGLTEFLPISSSGHLVLFQNILGYHEPLLVFDLAVHCGTLISIFIYFWKDLWKIVLEALSYLNQFPARKDREKLLAEKPGALIAGLVILATIPTVILGFSVKEVIEFLFGWLPSVGIAWIIMGVLLIVSRRYENATRPASEMNHRDAFFIGVSQGVAIIPGISRSGLTIFAGMMCGLKREDAARFSFLLAIPAILGATVLMAKEGVAFLEASPFVLAAGFLAAAIVGYFAIHLLMKMIQKKSFFLFGIYCILLGFVTVLVTWLNA